MQSKKDSLVIRKVTEGNFEQFLGLIAKLAEYEKLAPPDEEAKNRLRADCLWDKPRYEAFMAEIDGEYVGYVIYFFTYSSFLALPTLYVEDIFVLEPYRRRGVGQRMFDRCRAVAKETGCGRVEFTVLQWNKSAQAFYEKNGAKRMEWYLYRMVRKDF
jgi:GNAT superfamily N-acetyltransferase